MNKQQGFTLIELMIVVAIIAILAAIALPQYRNYTQRSANSACLAEAKAYMSAAVADAANGDTPANFTARACQSGANMTVALYNAAASSLTFNARARGATNLLQNTTCDTGSGSCQLAAAAQ